MIAFIDIAAVMQFYSPHRRTRAIIFRLVLALQLTAAISACTSVAPTYTPSLAASEALEEVGLRKMSTGSFSSTSAELEKLTIRGSRFVPPGGDSFALYLQKALQAELVQAGLFDQFSSAVVNGVLTSNSIDASGINVGVADIGANFSVAVDDRVVYRKNHSIHHEWESAFAGMTAVTRAHDNYVVAIRNLLMELFADPEFSAAIQSVNSKGGAEN